METDLEGGQRHALANALPHCNRILGAQTDLTSQALIQSLLSGGQLRLVVVANPDPAARARVVDLARGAITPSTRILELDTLRDFARLLDETVGFRHLLILSLCEATATVRMPGLAFARVSTDARRERRQALATLGRGDGCWRCRGLPMGSPALVWARAGFNQRPGCRCYALLMADKVKNQTRVSSKHQVTIPTGAFRTAGFEPGDTLKVEAEGAGRVVLTRVNELIDRYSGCLGTGGDLHKRVEGLREEWR